MNTKSVLIGVIIGAVVFGGGGYYFGTKHVPSAGGARQFSGNFQAGAQGGGTRGARMAGGFVGGEVIAKDTTSITVKEQNGSTKIILLGEGSQITKSTSGSAADLSIGINVIVTGQQNADGSMTAQTVQIRPAGLPAQAGAPLERTRATQ